MLGSAFAGAEDTLYLILLSLSTLLITNDPLYPPTGTPSILIGVSTSSPLIPSVISTVISVDDVLPSPALILLIPIFCPCDPTIRCSSIFA